MKRRNRASSRVLGTSFLIARNFYSFTEERLKQTNMASVYVPSKLLNLCIRNVVEQVEDNIDEIRLLPEEVKDKLLHLVSKRGSLSDENIGKVSGLEVFA